MELFLFVLEAIEMESGRSKSLETKSIIYIYSELEIKNSNSNMKSISKIVTKRYLVVKINGLIYIQLQQQMNGVFHNYNNKN